MPDPPVRRARLSSGNEHKLRELAAALPEWSLELLDTDEFPEEVGGTYYENARAKAQFGREFSSDDVWTLGEDSGIEVDGLDGQPGVASARWAPAGEQVERLLAALEGRAGDARRARYVCELVAMSPAGIELRGTGTLDGSIAAEAQGSEGFGYDPVFIPEGERQTVAQLGNKWKTRNSHRARASRSLLAAIAAEGSYARPSASSA